MSPIFNDRHAAAETIYQDWDFGDLTVATQNGWEHDGLDRFERVVFFEPQDGETESVRAVFAVEFAPGTARNYQVEFTAPQIEAETNLVP